MPSVKTCCTAIYYLDFIHSLYALQPRFEGWFFPSSSGEPTLLGPVDRASLYRVVCTYARAFYSLRTAQIIAMNRNFASYVWIIPRININNSY
jgi:hypothetical protein